MDNLLTLFIPIEMLIINLFVIDRCSKQKYSWAVTYGVLTAMGIVVIGLFFLITSISGDFGEGNGNGLFVFIGFLFLIPLKLLYETTIPKIVCLACTSWVYTFLIFSISINSTYLFSGMERVIVAFIIQSILYMVTIIGLLRILKQKFIFLLTQLSEKETLSLMWISIGWFWSIFVLNLSFVYSSVGVLKIITLVSIAVCAFNTYHYIYAVIKSDRTIQELEHIAYHDELTQVPGRALFNKDVEKAIAKEKPFYIVFMDLNKFKTVNDTYGHNVGDEYLAFFSQQMKFRIGINGEFYRLAGDEFVCIYNDRRIGRFLKSFMTLPSYLPNKNVPFLGVSYGIARCPKDGATASELIECADGRMYRMKEKVNGA